MNQIKQPPQILITLTALFASLAALNLSGCAAGKSSSGSSANGSAVTSDNSASGTVAGTVGGAITTSVSSGTQASYRFQAPPSFLRTIQAALYPMPSALAAGLCPTFVSSSSSGCSTSGSTMYLTYSACSFTGAATWNGVQALTMSTGSPSCGTFPNPGAGGTLYRQFVTAAGANTAGSATVTAGGVTETIDDASANLSNFDNDTIAAINPNSGYGTAVTFNSAGLRSQVSFGHHLSVPNSYDHSLNGSLAITEASGATSRSVGGTVTLYHNLLKVIATSAVSIVHDNTCCFPISGSISTTFSAGSNVNPTLAGSKYVGKTEKMTFTGCGTATLTQIDGSSINVSLARCL